jgi:bidirectional [NiFe] hydrogenase diaphorase subunit
MSTVQPAKSQLRGHSLEQNQVDVLDRTMERFNYRRDALLEVLTTAQETFGSLSRDILTYISRQLDIPLSRVYGVASFYHLYSLDTTDERHCFICGDVACAVSGGEEVLRAAVGEAKAASQGKIRVHRANCLGLCDQAPAAQLDDKAYAGLTADL